MSTSWNILRWIYASYYLLAGFAVYLSLIGFIPSSDEINFGKGINEFIAAMAKTGFALGALAATYAVSGLLILNNKTAHLGIITLAPAVVMIFLTHWFAEGGYPPWGSFHFSILLALAWRYRPAYKPLLDFSGNFQQERNDSFKQFT